MGVFALLGSHDRWLYISMTFFESLHPTGAIVRLRRPVDYDPPALISLNLTPHS
jgi:hypothetical protein